MSWKALALHFVCGDRTSLGIPNLRQITIVAGCPASLITSKPAHTTETKGLLFRTHHGATDNLHSIRCPTEMVTDSYSGLVKLCCTPSLSWITTLLSKSSFENQFWKLPTSSACSVPFYTLVLHYADTQTKSISILQQERHIVDAELERRGPCGLGHRKAEKRMFFGGSLNWKWMGKAGNTSHYLTRLMLLLIQSYTIWGYLSHSSLGSIQQKQHPLLMFFGFFFTQTGTKSKLFHQHHVTYDSKFGTWKLMGSQDLRRFANLSTWVGKLLETSRPNLHENQFCQTGCKFCDKPPKLQNMLHCIYIYNIWSFWVHRCFCKGRNQVVPWSGWSFYMARAASL